MRHLPWISLYLFTLACGGKKEGGPQSEDISGGEGGEGSDGAGEAPPTWYADVQPIMARSCEGCHSAGNIAPFQLVSYEEVAAMGEAVAQSVEARRMPPWLAGPDCTTYEPDLSLTQTEIATIRAWVDGGMVQGDPSTAPEEEPPAEMHLPRVDYSLTLPAPYTPQIAPDDYRCFVVDWDLEETIYVTGFEVIPDNKQIVHHLVAFLGGPEHREAFHAADAAEEGEGYTCYGGPGVIPQEDAEWLASWAPGGDLGLFPEGTGIALEPGSVIILQMHYNSASLEGLEPDQSTLNLMVEPEVERWAITQPWANPLWLYTDSMEIPANTEDVQHSFTYTMPPTGGNYSLHAISLHMHQLGQSGRMYIDREDGTRDCLLDVPRWDFNWQRDYAFSEEKPLGPGDRITIECEWDNLTDEAVYWGEGTGDEMCLGVTYLSAPPVE